MEWAKHNWQLLLFSMFVFVCGVPLFGKDAESEQKELLLLLLWNEKGGALTRTLGSRRVCKNNGQRPKIFHSSISFRINTKAFMMLSIRSFFNFPILLSVRRAGKSLQLTINNRMSAQWIFMAGNHNIRWGCAVDDENTRAHSILWAFGENCCEQSVTKSRVPGKVRNAVKLFETARRVVCFSEFAKSFKLKRFSSLQSFATQNPVASASL